MTNVIAPITCPKWHKCNAPLCPLDPDVFKRVMRSDEPVCFYLTEAAKFDAEAIFRSRGWGELYEVISSVLPTMSSRWARIRLALERAKLTGSRMARLSPWEVSHAHAPVSTMPDLTSRLGGV